MNFFDIFEGGARIPLLVSQELRIGVIRCFGLLDQELDPTKRLAASNHPTLLLLVPPSPLVTDLNEVL